MTKQLIHVKKDILPEKKKNSIRYLKKSEKKDVSYHMQLHLNIRNFPNRSLVT